MSLFKKDEELHPINAYAHSSIDNLESQYKERNLLKAYLGEVTTNGIIDNKAEEMHFNLGKDDSNPNINAYLYFYDNGIGISDFYRYNDIGRPIAFKSPLGKHGEGSKVLHKKVEYIKTETKSHKPNGARFIGACEAPFPQVIDGITRYSWKEIKTLNRNPFDTGIFVEVKLKYYEDKKNLTEGLIQGVLQKWFSPILYGYYPGRFFINEKKVEPVKLYPETTRDIPIKIMGHSVRCIFIKNKLRMHDCESREGVLGIVVNGKVITWKTPERSRFDDQLCGFVFADELLRDLVMRGKSEFQEDDKKIVKTLDKEVEKLYSEWIEAIGGKPERNKNVNVEKSTKDQGQFLYKVLKNNLKDYFKILMDRGELKQVNLKNPDGTIPGDPEDLVTTKAEQKPGKYPPRYPGPDVDTDEVVLNKDEDGKELGKKGQRRVRIPEIPIVAYNAPCDEIRESWWRIEKINGKEKKAVILNTNHPSYRFASPSKYSRDYHILRVAITAISEELLKEYPAETTETLFYSICEKASVEQKRGDN